MKRVIAVAVTTMLLGAGCWAGQSEYRKFTSLDGRVIMGCIKRFNEMKQEVLIERANSAKNIWISPFAFCEADQKYIESWISTEQFMHALQISAKEQEGHTQSFHYVLTLKNKSKTDFKNLYMDYRMYTDAGSAGRALCVGRDQYIGDIDAGQTLAIKTNGQSLRGGRAAGIWIRIYGPEVDGQRGMKEITFPSALKKKKSWEQTPRRPKVLVHTTSGGSSEYAQAMNVWQGKNGEIKDVQKAIELFEVSAENGTPKSYYWIGDIYYRGAGVEKDWAMAARWFAKGFDAGWSSSASWLGKMYLKGGAGLQKDEELALRWWKDGADLEDQNCLRELAWYYGANRTASKRSGELAAVYADQLMDGGSDYFLYIGAAAAAYAQAGQFGYAIYLQTKVVNFVNTQYPEEKNKKYRAGFQKNLDRFKQGKALPTKN